MTLDASVSAGSRPDPGPPDSGAGPGPSGGPGRPTAEEAVLAAAKATLLAVGVRRTTLTEVARRAGVSRMTLYRRWPDLRSLVGDVMTREWIQVVSVGTDTAPPGPDGGLDDVVAHILATVEAFRVNPVYLRVVETDPELLLPYLIERRGATQQLVIDLLADQLGAAAARGAVRAADPAALAVMVLLVVQSYVLSANALGGDVGPARLAAELRQLLHAYLAPGPTRPTGGTDSLEGGPGPAPRILRSPRPDRRPAPTDGSDPADENPGDLP